MKKWKIVLPILLVVALVCLCLLLFLGGKEYTVSFLNEDGTVIHTATYPKGNQMIVPEDPEKEGHSFVGWVLKGEKEAYNFSADGAKTVARDMEFTAVFTPNSYTVKFVASNGKDVITSESYRYGEAFTVPEAPVLTGHKSIGWVKQGETAVCDFAADGAKVTKGDAVYVAKYDPIESKISFTDYDGSVLNEQTHTYGAFFTVPEDPVREGYEFRGWVLSGQTELYDFEANDARRVGETDTVFVAIYDKLEIVAGKLIKVGGAGFPDKVTIRFGEYARTVAVGADGSFTTQLPAGKYKILVALDGYRCLIDTVTVSAGGCKIGEVKLQQTVSKDYEWWNGGEASVDGSSVTVTVKDGDLNKGDSGIEYQIGSPITGATSWKISSHIAKGATGMHGFSAGLNDKGATLFIYVTGSETGFYSWATLMDSSAEEDTRQRGWPLSEEAKKAMAADDGYQLTLAATNIVGAGTGWLTMYVNDIAVLQIENTFVGSGDRSTAGEKVNLSNVELCLTTRVTGNTVTYTDYYYVADAETALPLGTISGKLTKQDGVEMPKCAVVANGVTYRTIPVAADGRIVATVPVGEYRITAVGYTSVDDSIPVTAKTQDLGEVKLRQSLSSSMTWWGGGSLNESGSSATITMPDGEGVSTDVGHEFQIGTNFTGATSWKATAHVAKGAIEQRGFSFGTANGKNGTLFIYVDDYNAGFYTWNTFQNEAGANNSWNNPLSSAVKEAMATEEGYDLTLAATNIDGEGTGWLVLYVNDIPVLALENTFVSVPGDHIEENVVMDLGNGHISLVAHKNGASATFSDYSYVINQEKDLAIGTVSGRIVMMDGTEIPGEVRFSDGLISKAAKVNADGTFTATVPAGEYGISTDDYRGAVDRISVAEGTKDLGQVTLLQSLSDGGSWWGGGALTESGNSAVITLPAAGNDNVGHEYQIGNPITGATSWKVSAHIAKGATGRRGFSIAPINARNAETVFLWVEDGTAGFFTWSTYADENGNLSAWDYTFDDAAKVATASDDGYDLTLVATNIDGAGTGWLTMYVNDIAVMQIENTFVGTGDRTNVGDKIDLGNAVVSLAATNPGNAVAFSDYYYAVNQEQDLVMSTVSGELTKLDNCAMPEAIVLTNGAVKKSVSVTNGAFSVKLPLGTYQLKADNHRSVASNFAVDDETESLGQIKLLQNLIESGSWWYGGTLSESGNSAAVTVNSGHGDSGVEYKIGETITNADSWRVSTHIAKGTSNYRRGFSIAPAADRNGETVFIWIEDGTAGFYTWNTFADVDGNTLVWDYGFDETVRNAISAADGYDLTLVATNINGAGTGWLSLYVNDTLVMQLENTFVGTGDRTAAGDKIDLSNVVVSLAAYSPNNTVTFSDYFYRVNRESDLAVGTVSGKLTKLDGTAVPGKLSLTAGKIRKTVKVNADGTFSVTLPVDTYSIGAVEGYRGSISSITVAEGSNADVELKLLQNLIESGSWWYGGTLSESGNSAAVTVNSGHGDSGVEYKIGETITNADSWRVSTHIAKGASNYRRGFSIAPAADRNGETVFIWIEDGTAGFYTWNTYADGNGNTLVWDYGFDETVRNAISNADGYDLTLVATNIDGAGTGWLSLYVNDTLVMQLENTFVGTGDRTAAGDKIDLSNVVVSLAAYSPDNTVTFSDYYYRVNEESDLAVGTVSGKLTKLDGTAVPGKLSLTAGKIRKTVKVNADGTFGVTLPVDTYSIGAVEGYRGSISSITVAEGSNADVELKLLQNLAADGGWWGSGSYTEGGNSATITVSSFNGDATHGDSGKEVRVGNAITGATSWTVAAHINDDLGATSNIRRGLSIGVNGTEATLFVWVENTGYVGWYSWSTLISGSATEGSIKMDDEAAAAVQSGDFDMKVVAAEINGAGTGTLTVYINDTQVYQLTNDFVGNDNRLGQGVTVDFSSAALCLAARTGGTVVTYSDYYCTYTTN